MKITPAIATVLVALIGAGATLLNTYITTLHNAAPSDKTGTVSASGDHSNNTAIGQINVDTGAKQEVSANPRKELNNMGIPWEYENFRQSLFNGDKMAIELFLQGGMTVHPGEYLKDPIYYETDFMSFVRSRTFSADIAQMLIKYNAITTNDNCPLDDRGMSFYEDYGFDPARANFIRQVCATPEIRQTLEKGLANYKTLIAKQSEPGHDVSRCKTELQDVTEDNWYNEAAHLSYATLNTLPLAGQKVLTKLNAALISGQASNQAERHALLVQAINEACPEAPAREDPRLKTATAKRMEKYEYALKLLQ